MGSDDQRFEIFANTFSQSECDEWTNERKNRITASIARRIFKAKKDDTLLKYFYGCPFSNENTKYGNTMEPHAKAEYESITGYKVRR